MTENPYASPKAEPIPALAGTTGFQNSPYGPYREINGIGWAVIAILIVTMSRAQRESANAHKLRAA